MNATQIFSPREYWRVTVNAATGKKTYWASDFARKGSRFSFCVVDRDGSKTGKVVLGMGDDLVSVTSARLNLFFATMQAN